MALDMDLNSVRREQEEPTMGPLHDPTADMNLSFIGNAGVQMAVDKVRFQQQLAGALENVTVVKIPGVNGGPAQYGFTGGEAAMNNLENLLKKNNFKGIGNAHVADGSRVLTLADSANAQVAKLIEGGAASRGSKILSSLSVEPNVGRAFQEAAAKGVIELESVTAGLVEAGSRTAREVAARTRTLPITQRFQTLSFGADTPAAIGMDIGKASAPGVSDLKIRDKLTSLEKQLETQGAKKVKLRAENINGRVVAVVEEGSVASFNNAAKNVADAKELTRLLDGKKLPDGTKLKIDTGLTHPEAVVDNLIKNNPQAVREFGVNKLIAEERNLLDRIKGTNKGAAGVLAEAEVSAGTLKNAGVKAPGVPGQSMTRFGGGAIAIFGAHQLITDSDVVGKGVGALNVALGGSMVASTVGNTATKAVAGSVAKKLFWPAAIAAVGYEMYKEEGVAGNKLGYQVARGAVGAASIAGGIAATAGTAALIGTAAGPIGTAVGFIVGAVVGVGIALGGNHLIDKHKEGALKEHQEKLQAEAKAKDDIKRGKFNELAKVISTDGPNAKGDYEIKAKDFDPKGTGQLALANFANSKGMYTQIEADKLKEKIKALQGLVEMTKSPELKNILEGLKEVHAEGARALAIAQMEVAQARSLGKVAPSLSAIGVNTNEIANSTVTASAPPQPASVGAPDIARAQQVAVAVAAANNIDPQQARISDARLATDVQAQTNVGTAQQQNLPMIY